MPGLHSKECRPFGLLIALRFYWYDSCKTVSENIFNHGWHKHCFVDLKVLERPMKPPVSLMHYRLKRALETYSEALARLAGSTPEPWQPTMKLYILAWIVLHSQFENPEWHETCYCINYAIYRRVRRSPSREVET